MKPMISTNVWGSGNRAGHLLSRAAPVLGALALACAAAAPAEDGSAEPTLGEAQIPITGGTRIGVAEYPSAVRISVPGTNEVCSAVKISGTPASKISTFLTAAHCVRTAATTVNISNAEAPTLPMPSYNLYTTIRVHPSFVLNGGIDAAIYLNVYDLALVAVADPNLALAGIPQAALTNPSPPAVGTNLTAVGYGCNQALATDTHNGKKQKGAMTVASQSGFNFVHNIRDLNAPTACSGDSGGPLFNSSNIVVGLTIASDSSGSYFTRVGNVLDWIQSPLPGNDPALVANNSNVFLMNTKSGIGKCMAAASRSAVSPVGAQLAECDNPNGDIGLKPPGFRICNDSSCSGSLSSTFVLINRWSGMCLTVDPANPTAESAAVRLQPCELPTSAVGAGQRWKLGTIVNSRRTLINNKSGKCVTTAGGGDSVGAQLVQKTCESTSGTAFGWMLTR